MKSLFDSAAGQTDDLTNLAGEVVFAPKELKVAQDLSERLGYATISGRTRSRPSGLSSGRRSLSESDHRRALMLPQELTQMAADRLIVLRAGLPPVRGRKIAYYREHAFQARLRPAPVIGPRPINPPVRASLPMDVISTGEAIALHEIDPLLREAGLAPPPPRGASEAEVASWVDQFIDGVAPPLPVLEASHG
jgi:type IV secretion system protein VirD4